MNQGGKNWPSLLGEEPGNKNNFTGKEDLQVKWKRERKTRSPANLHHRPKQKKIAGSQPPTGNDPMGETEKFSLHEMGGSPHPNALKKNLTVAQRKQLKTALPVVPPSKGMGKFTAHSNLKKKWKLNRNPQPWKKRNRLPPTKGFGSPKIGGIAPGGERWMQAPSLGLGSFAHVVNQWILGDWGEGREKRQLTEPWGGASLLATKFRRGRNQ